VHRRACLLTLLAAGCDRPARRVTSAAPPAAASVTRPPYRALRARIAEVRDELAERYETEKTVLGAAKRELQSAIADVLLPAWLGTRWAFHGTADEPLAPEGIACGYFVAAILQHASIHLESRKAFARSTALTIARSLIPAGPSHHRVFSVPARFLEQKVRSFGDGIYLLGLDVHVGFVIVRGESVRVVHASYTGARRVVDEPIAECEAVERSREAGYHVTALFADNTLTEAWLDGRTIPLLRA